MLEEIPYGVYTENDISNNLIENKNIPILVEIPISVEVVPHKAILIVDAQEPTSRSRRDRRSRGSFTINNENTLMQRFKYIFYTVYSIPIVMVLGGFVYNSTY